jgi:hypothetical protein
MIVGCYTLDLYCDRDNPDGYTIADIPEHGFREFPHQFTGHTEGVCMRDAKRRGWRFQDGKAYCPRCAVTLKMARKKKPRKSDGQTAGWIDVIKAIGKE